MDVAKRCFDLSTRVLGAPSTVIDFLTDLERHRGLHPYLVSAQVVGNGVSHRGPWQDWVVVERPRLGPFSYRLRFRARLTQTSATSLEARVRPLPGCRLRTSTRAEVSADGGTLLTENVVAIAPWLLVDYLAHQARSAHRRTFERLPAALVS